MGIDAKLLWRWTKIGAAIHVCYALVIILVLGDLVWKYLLN